MLEVYWRAFAELIKTPFQDSVLIWGIVPLYFGLLLNELTSSKANYRTALQTGFSFVWAAAQWVYPWFRKTSDGSAHQIPSLPAINLFVTTTVFTLGLVAFISGMRRRFPKYFSFLGYSRFANYFMIMIFPIQAHAPGVSWSWERLTAIGLFAIPVWLLLHFGLMPLRKR